LLVLLIILLLDLLEQLFDLLDVGVEVLVVVLLVVLYLADEVNRRNQQRRTIINFRVLFAIGLKRFIET
jgi:hypothetical protein